MNGQQERIAIVREIAERCNIDRIIETGTFRGGTTLLLADLFDRPVETVENDSRFHAAAARSLSRAPQVTLVHGDSRNFLRDLAARPDLADKRVFAYLDAHWERDLPLAEELRIISAAWPEAVVMIDDFEVPGDPGYGFDDYGPEVGTLAAAILPPEVSDWSLMYPRATSSEETGARRGCCVLVSPGVGTMQWATLLPAATKQATRGRATSRGRRP